MYAVSRLPSMLRKMHPGTCGGTVSADEGHEESIASQAGCVRVKKNHRHGDLMVTNPGEAQKITLPHLCEVLSLQPSFSVSENNAGVNPGQVASDVGSNSDRGRDTENTGMHTACHLSDWGLV